MNNSRAGAPLNQGFKSVYFAFVCLVFALGGCAATGGYVKQQPEQEIYIDENGNEYIVEYVDEVEEASGGPEEGEIVIIEEEAEPEAAQGEAAEIVEESQPEVPEAVRQEALYNPLPGSKQHKVWIWQETGDCLWSIAKQYYGDPWKWKKIYMANQNTIKDPNTIFPKQIISIPPDE